MHANREYIESIDGDPSVYFRYKHSPTYQWTISFNQACKDDVGQNLRNCRHVAISSSSLHVRHRTICALHFALCFSNSFGFSGSDSSRRSVPISGIAPTKYEFLTIRRNVGSTSSCWDPWINIAFMKMALSIPRNASRSLQQLCNILL